ncbi:MAG: extracellular solute-binding protein [Anaerolineales bacterium]|nr:extracellular solute-binding protein [Anaerolineales bacterium]
MILCLALLAACAPGEPQVASTPTRTEQPTPNPTPAPTPTPDVIAGTVTVWHAWEEFERSALYRRIAAFQVEYPDVQFDVTYVPMDDLRGSFEAAAAEKADPAILLAPAEWGPALYDRGFVLDLSGAFSGELLATLNPAALEAASYRAAQISLPLHLKGVVLYRNTSLIPSSPATFQDLKRLAHNPAKGEAIGAVLERSFFYSAGHLYGLGGKLLTPEGDPAFQEEDYRAAVAWLELLKSFEGIGPTEYMTDNDLKLFREGRAGFIIDGTWNLFDLADAIDPLNLAIDPWPAQDGGHLSGFVQAECIYITPRAIEESERASRLFVAWMLSPESQKALADVNFIPAISADPQVGAIDLIGNPFIAQAMVALRDGAAYSSLPEMSLYTTYLEVAIQSVLFQGVAPRAALEAAYTAIQSALPGVRVAPSPAP